jgi:hypothetical protein
MKVGYLSIINSSCNRGVDTNINNNLEVGATWEYSINGNGFVNGTDNSFMLANNTTYEANAIQVRQIDVANNIACNINGNNSNFVNTYLGLFFLIF